MKKVAFVILALSLCFNYCGRDEKTGPPEGHKTPPRPEPDTPGRRRWPGRRGPGEPPVHRNIAYNAESLDSQTDLTAIPVLEEPEMEEVEFRFQWFVNGEKVPADTGVLEKNILKRTIGSIAWLRPLKDGEMSNVFRGDYIRVPNTPPELVPSPIPMLYGAGDHLPINPGQGYRRRQLTYKLLFSALGP